MNGFTGIQFAQIEKWSRKFKIMWQYFNEPARRAILLAQENASLLIACDDVDTEHLLHALMVDSENRAAQILKKHNIDSMTLLEIGMAEEVPEQTKPANETGGFLDERMVKQMEKRLLRKLRNQELQLSERVKRALEFAAGEARETHKVFRGSTQIGTEHLLLGLLHPQNSYVNQIFDQLGFDLDTARIAVFQHLREQAH